MRVPTQSRFCKNGHLRRKERCTYRVKRAMGKEATADDVHIVNDIGRHRFVL